MYNGDIISHRVNEKARSFLHAFIIHQFIDIY